MSHSKPSDTPGASSKGLISARNAFIRCFLVGGGIKLGLSLLKALITFRQPKYRQLLEDVTRIGLLLGVQAGSFKVLLHYLRILRQKDDGANSLIAGALSGLSLKFASSEDRGILALYSIVRATDVFLRTMASLDKLPKFLVNFEYYDVILMCFSASQILWAYIFMPESLDPNYYRFLCKHGAAPRGTLTAANHMYVGKPLNKELLANYLKPFNKTIEDVSDPSLPGGLNLCHILHPHQNCFSHFVSFFTSGLKKAVSVYLPIHGLYTLYILWRGTKQPLHVILQRFAQNMAVSTTFLALYCVTAWKVLCFLSSVVKVKTDTPIRFTLLASGLAVLLEHKARRMELALYCLPRALESLYNSLILKKKIKPLRFGEFPMFMFAMAVTVWCYERHSDSMKPTMRSALQWLWGHSKPAYPAKSPRVPRNEHL